MSRARRAAGSRWIVPLGVVAILTGVAGKPPLLPAPVPLGVATADAAHPFYERRLAEGTLALKQERFDEAARLLEIAAFGCLDEPPRLAEALVRLALAQAEMDEPGAFRETLRRVAEIEERFGAYREADLSPAERSAFDRRITELTPAAELDRSPALQLLLQSPAESGTTPQDARDPEPAGSTAPEPEPGDGSAEAPAAAAPTETVSPVPASELTPKERQRLLRAREILDAARQASELEEAWTLAHPIADAHPARKELQQLVGEIAYRASRWEESARYLEKGLAPVLEALDVPGSPRPERPELVFYLAVALFESGRPAEAKDPLELALPRLERTPFVQSYVEKILQAQASEPSSETPERTP